MSDTQHQFKPLQAPQAVSVHWVLSEEDHNKLQRGNEESKNHWHFLMRDDTVHIYKGFGGDEHYRFALNKQTDGTYVVESVETSDTTRFIEQARLHGWTEAKIEEQSAKHKLVAVGEAAEMLMQFFGIDVSERLE